MLRPVISLGCFVFSVALLIGCNQAKNDTPQTSNSTPTVNPTPKNETPSPKTTEPTKPTEPTPTPKPMGSVTVLKEANVFPAGAKAYKWQITLSLDGNTAAVARNHEVRLVDTTSGKEMAWKDAKTAEKMKEQLGAALYSADGKQLWVVTAIDCSQISEV